MVFEEQAFTRVILDFLRASAKDVEEIQSCWSKMRTCMNNMDETIESYQRERRAEEDMQDRLGTNFHAQYIDLGSGRCGSTFVVPSGCGATIKSRDELLCDKKEKWANVSSKKKKMLARPSPFNDDNTVCDRCHRQEVRLKVPVARDGVSSTVSVALLKCIKNVIKSEECYIFILDRE